MSDFRDELAKAATRCKLEKTTMKEFSAESGVSQGIIRRMMYKDGDVRLGAVLAVLESSGYELIIRKKEETR